MRQLWTTFTKIGLPLIAIALLLLTGATLAAGTLTIDRWVIGGRGGHSEAGSYVLDATVGQGGGRGDEQCPLRTLRRLLVRDGEVQSLPAAGAAEFVGHDCPRAGHGQ